MFHPEPPPFPLRTVSADQLAAIGVSIAPIPPRPLWEEPMDRLAALLPGGWQRPQVQKAPYAAPPRLGLTIIDETVLAVVTAPRWTIIHRTSWLRSGRDPAVPGARFVVIADPAGHAEALRLALPAPLTPGQLPATACGRDQGAPAPPAGGISAAYATKLAGHYEQPGMGFALCAVPQQVEIAVPGNGAAADHWAWRVVMASGSFGCPGYPSPAQSGPPPPPGAAWPPFCFEPTTRFATYDYLSGGVIPGDQPEFLELRLTVPANAGSR